ncbi:MAG: hypothetical protein WAZ48_01805 [Lysobacteraceae bacterium]
MSAVHTAPENARDPLAALRVLDDRLLPALLGEDALLLASLRAEVRQRLLGEAGPWACHADPRCTRAR